MCAWPGGKKETYVEIYEQYTVVDKKNNLILTKK
jgi:hypothetical protein